MKIKRVDLKSVILHKESQVKLEIKKRVHNESRYQSPKSVRKSINKLTDLIRCNAADSTKCKWLPLTYGGVMTDHKQVFEDSAPHIANEIIAKLWGFGIADTRKVSDSDGLSKTSGRWYA